MHVNVLTINLKEYFVTRKMTVFWNWVTNVVKMYSYFWNWCFLVGEKGRKNILCPNKRKPARTRMRCVAASSGLTHCFPVRTGMSNLVGQTTNNMTLSINEKKIWPTIYKIRCFGWCFQLTVPILKYIFQHPSVHMGHKAGMWCYTYSPFLCKSSNFSKKKPASLASFLVTAEQCMHQYHQCTAAWAGSGLYPRWQAEPGSQQLLLFAV